MYADMMSDRCDVVMNGMFNNLNTSPFESF